ncbi:MAG: sulfatase-like hydrolase/transferase [Wenzhouxiangellaceae bacterium]|nr:sulfatase-like hydrolase/transferase [Wenzhouxiangellaceae bacterium]
MPRIPAIRAILPVALLLLAAACGEPERPPHIFLISIDTLRADYLEPYGFDAVETPTARRLAEGGVLFTRAVTPMGITVPVHATMLTGLMPRRHAVRANVHRLPDEVPTVAAALSGAGYRTASILSFGAMNFMAGLDRGFEHASDRDEAGREFVRGDSETLEMALEWLGRQDGSEPLFMLVHFYDVHSPHLPTGHTPSMPDGYTGPLADGVGVETLYNESHQTIAGRPEELAALRALYAGEAATADHRAGQFIDALREKGLLDNAIVIYVADHGQGLGENDYFGHGPTLEQTVLHVPLIIRDFRAPARGRRVTETVGLIDLAPTILGLAGIPDDGLPGRDLLAVGGESEPAVYLSEVEQRSSQTEFRPEHYDEQALAAFFDDFKLVEQDGGQRLYRIDDEWGQHIEPVALDEMHESLRAWLSDTMQAYREGSLESERAELDDEALEKLRSLGYIQ